MTVTKKAEFKRVPHSSVVGSSFMLSVEGIGCVSILMVSVPQPFLDYKIVADAVCEALAEKVGPTLTLKLEDGYYRKQGGIG